MAVKKREDEDILRHGILTLESNAAFTEKELIQSLSVLKMKFL